MTETVLQKAQRHAGIDAVRYIAFMFVVILHCLPSAESSTTYDVIVNYLCRFAVPFFFITSGYFLGERDPAFWPGTLRILKRLLPILSYGSYFM